MSNYMLLAILATTLTACGEDSPFGGKDHGTDDGSNPSPTETEPTGLHTTEYGWTGTVADDPAVVTVEMSILGVPIEDATVWVGRDLWGDGTTDLIPEPVGLVGEAIAIAPDDRLHIVAGEADRMSWDNLPLVWDQASGMEWGCRRELISLAPGSETTIDCPANVQFDQVMACSRSLYSSYNADTGAVGELIDLTEFDPERVYVENGYLPQSETFSDLDDFQIVGDQLEFLPNDEGFEMVASIISSQSVEIHYWSWSHYTEMFCLPVSD